MTIQELSSMLVVSKNRCRVRIELPLMLNNDEFLERIEESTKRDIARAMGELIIESWPIKKLKPDVSNPSTYNTFELDVFVFSKEELVDYLKRLEFISING